MKTIVIKTQKEWHELPSEFKEVTEIEIKTDGSFWLEIKSTPKNGNVYAYIALPEFTTTTDSNIANNAIALKYINVVEASFNYFGENFKIDYQNSTIPYPPSIAKELKTKLNK